MMAISETYFRNFIQDMGQIPGQDDLQYQVDSFTGNGSSNVFTLSFSPATVYPVFAYINGLLVELTTDYSVAGNLLIFVMPPLNFIPIKACYWH
jgi:hypothetical protein